MRTTATEGRETAGGQAAGRSGPARPRPRRMGERAVAAIFFTLVAVLGACYFGQDGMYRTILPLVPRYVGQAWRARSGAPTVERFALDLGTPRQVAGEFGGGPILAQGGKTRVAVTAPALRVVLPRFRPGGAYEVRVTVSARLAAPGRVELRLGDELRGAATVSGSGAPEIITWRVPGRVLAACEQPLLLIPSWEPRDRVRAGGREQAVWCHLCALSVVPAEGSHVP